MAVDIAPAVAFGAGLLSFFSPCVVPLVPGYLAFVTGGTDVPTRTRRIRTLVFVAGFAIAFTILGVAIGAVGSTGVFRAADALVQRVAGAFIIVFGLVMLDLVPLSFLYRDVRHHGGAPDWAGPTFGALFLGAAFGLGWSACAGPILASVLVLAGLEGGVGPGASLLLIYSAGLAVPFIVLGFSADRGASFVKRIGNNARTIQIVGGIALVALGIAIFTGAAARLTSLLV